MAVNQLQYEVNLKRRILGVIPSRWGSQRFPGKSLHLIGGKPLVLWVVEAAQRAESLDEVIVATDDERIAAAVQEHVRVVMTSVDHPSGTDRVAEAAQAADTDIVINIQGDEPLIEPALIDQLADRMCDNDAWSMATVVTPIVCEVDLLSPTVVKVVADKEGGALYFSRAPIPFVRDATPQFAAGRYLRHLGIYAYRGDFLRRLVREPPCQMELTESLEQLRALYIGGRIALVHGDTISIGVDTPADVARVEAVLERRVVYEKG